MSTLLYKQEDSRPVTPSRTTFWLRWVLANAVAELLGLGPILALPQWVVLRRHVARAGWWVPANALAWALGMVLVFVAAGSVPGARLTPFVVLWLLLALLTAGAIVGAVHGLALLRLLPFRK